MRREDILRVGVLENIQTSASQETVHKLAVFSFPCFIQRVSNISKDFQENLYVISKTFSFFSC